MDSENKCWWANFLCKRRNGHKNNNFSENLVLYVEQYSNESMNIDKIVAACTRGNEESFKCVRHYKETLDVLMIKSQTINNF